MTKLILSTLIATSTVAFAEDVTLFCRGENCSQRVVTALTQMNCQPAAESIKCQNAESEPGQEVCQVSTNNCSEPRADLVLTYHCIAGHRVSMKSVDQGLSLTWWMGFGPYIRSLCVH